MICGIYTEDELVELINKYLNRTIYIFDVVVDEKIKKKLGVMLVTEMLDWDHSPIKFVLLYIDENKYLVYKNDSDKILKDFYDFDHYYGLIDNINKIIKTIKKVDKGILKSVKRSKISKEELIQNIDRILNKTKLIRLNEDKSKDYISTRSFLMFNPFSDDEFDIVEINDECVDKSKIIDIVNGSKTSTELTKGEIIKEIKFVFNNKYSNIDEGKELILLTKGYL